MKRTNKILYFPFINLNSGSEIRDDYKFTFEDVFSEDLSKTSDAFDRSMMKDLIETTDTGIQSEVLFNY